MRVQIVHNRENFEDLFDDLFLFCVKAVEQIKEQSIEQGIDFSQTITNMDYINWETNNECLLYRIYKTAKLNGNHGMMVLLYDGDDIVALSGVEMWNKYTVSLGKRAFTLREYRNKLINTKYLMPEQMKWTNLVQPQRKLFIVTVNEYLKNHSFSALKYWINSEIDYWVDWRVFDGKFEFFGIPQYFVYHLVDKTIEDTKENIIEILSS